MRVLGISAFYHDSAAALIVDGEIVGAAQEERFTRKKHDAGFPRNAIEYCLSEGDCPLREIDYVVFYEKPFLKFERLLETYLAFAPRGLKSLFLGPSYDQGTIEQQLSGEGAVYENASDGEVIDVTARSLAEGKAVGWFQGRMEFGPRALGSRSILADPRSPTMQKLLNLKIKHRESFRPFAPAVLREDVASWFELDYDSPYMLLVADVKREHLREMTADERKLFGIDKLNVTRSTIPAVTHVDNSARVQTVHSDTNPRFHALLTRFKELTGCPVLVNTSFNVRGEPIVCSPKDALRCFLGTELDLLVCGNALLWKDRQAPSKKMKYLHEFELD